MGLVVRNVCDAVDPPRVPKSEITPLDPDQVGKLLAAAAGDRLEASISWQSVRAYVWASCSACSGASRLKSRHGVRAAYANRSRRQAHAYRAKDGKGPPPRNVAAACRGCLVEHRKRMVAAGFAGVPFVFCNSIGGPLRRSHFHRNEFKPLLKRAELPDIRFHDLRHTSATLLLAQGVHPRWCRSDSATPRYRSPSTPIRTSCRRCRRDAASRLDSMLVREPRRLRMAVNWR